MKSMENKLEKLITEISNHKFEKGVILTPDKIKLLQQLSVFMIINDEWQKLDFFELKLENLNDLDFRKKIQEIKDSPQCQLFLKTIEENNLEIKFTLASIIFILNLIDSDEELLIYLLFIYIKAKRKSIKEINYFIIINDFFPISTFKKDEIEKYLSLQNEGGVNLIYEKSLWEMAKIVKFII